MYRYSVNQERKFRIEWDTPLIYKEIVNIIIDKVIKKGYVSMKELEDIITHTIKIDINRSSGRNLFNSVICSVIDSYRVFLTSGTHKINNKILELSGDTYIMSIEFIDTKIN